jgi:hypothetical protein
VKVGHHLRVLTNSSEAKVEKFISAAGKISIDLTIHEKKWNNDQTPASYNLSPSPLGS